MTIICALHVGGETWIGGDSRITGANGDLFPVRGQKWAVSGGRALGLAGTGRSMNLLTQAVAGGGLLEETSLDVITQRLLAAFRSAGYEGKTEQSSSPRWGCSLIYAAPDGVWDVDSEFGFARISDGILWARGSGADYAIGADHALRAFANPAFTPKVRIETALAAAIEFDTGCGGPVMVRKL